MERGEVTTSTALVGCFCYARKQNRVYLPKDPPHQTRTFLTSVPNWDVPDVQELFELEELAELAELVELVESMDMERMTGASPSPGSSIDTFRRFAAWVTEANLLDSIDRGEEGGCARGGVATTLEGGMAC